MMRIKLAYGKEGLWVELPYSNLTVLEPKFIAGVSNEEEAIRAALRAPVGAPPLKDQVQSSDTVAIVFSDITRPQPRKKMLPVLLNELAHVPKDQIVVINALGTHRLNTHDELVEMLGKEILDNYRVLQHNAWDRERMVYLGKTSFGNETYINAEYMNAQVKILTGFIEPHFFAGFSGGPKAILPALAHYKSVLTNHGAQMIGHPNATWGVTTDNPIWEEMLEVALLTQPTFLLNVTLNRDKQITGVFAGDLIQAHAAGTAFCHSAAMVPVPKPFDIVITSNSGYPLDLNLYQSVKGMSAAAQVVKPGGSIIVAAECWDGIPDHGEYKHLLQMASTPQEILRLINSEGFSSQDQWQVQIQAQIQLKADVYVHSGYLSPEDIQRCMFHPCESIEATISQLLERYGREASICVIPQGPMTIPYITP
jgi:nickel-dependent lactate racemase